MDELYQNLVRLSPKEQVPFRCIGCGECCRHVHMQVPVETLDAFRIRKQMDLFLDTQKTLLGLIALEKEKAKHSVPANRVKELQDKLDQKKKLFSRLYIDFKDGILTQQEYLLARDVYQKEIAAYESELQELQAIKTKTKVTETGARKWNRLISRYYKTKTVTEEMVEAMVDEIRVNTDGSLDIRFKYMPEFEEMFKECERIRKEVA